MIESLIKGNTYFEQGHSAMMGPSRDIVVTAACGFARNAIENFMLTFLHVSGKDATKCHDLQDMIDLCTASETDLSAMDFSSLKCKAGDFANSGKTYCQCRDNAEACLELANKLRTLLLQKLGLSESDLNKLSTQNEAERNKAWWIDAAGSLISED